jgi:hypothetical protein
MTCFRHNFVILLSKFKSACKNLECFQSAASFETWMLGKNASATISRHKRRRSDLNNIIKATVEEAVANVEVSKEKKTTQTRTRVTGP